MNSFFESILNFLNSENESKPKKKRGRPCKYFKDIEYGYMPELSYLMNKKLNNIETVYPL